MSSFNQLNLDEKIN